MAAKAKHRFTTCHDADCPRLPCIAYKTGFQDGYQQGLDAGSQEGETQQ